MEGNPLVGKPMEEDRGRVGILEAGMGSELVCNRRVVGRVGVDMRREGMADLGGARRVDIQLREDMVALGGEVGVYIHQQWCAWSGRGGGCVYGKEPGYGWYPTVGGYGWSSRDIT